MYNSKDNIVALATSPGKSALNVVRCSGCDCLSLYKELTSSKKTPRPNYAHLKTIKFRGSVIDKMMITYFMGPKSYTGEDMIEFSMHGGLVVVGRFMDAVCSFGLREAYPGEFSYRSFVNGKIDLIQAEAINSLINTNNHLDVFYSLNNIKGGLSRVLLGVRNKLEKIITYIEHELDFDEEEIDFIDIEKHIKKTKKTAKEIKIILESSFSANKKHGSIVIVLAGRTNVGKSSLFNRLLGYDRSIITNKKGTTRDTVEADLLVGGVDITLTDTAGIRQTKETIEKIGISKTYSAIKGSNIVLFVDDKNPTEESKKYSGLLKNKKIIYIQNKIDKNKKKSSNQALLVSATKKIGIKKLFTKILTETRKEFNTFKTNHLFLINARQKNHIINSYNKIEEAIKVGEKTKDLVVFVSYLRSANDELASILGYRDNEKIINNIFKGFCVGK